MPVICVVAAPGLVGGVGLCVGPQNQIHVQMKSGQVWTCSAHDTLQHTVVTAKGLDLGGATALAVTTQGRFVTTYKKSGMVDWDTRTENSMVLLDRPTSEDVTAGITTMPHDLFACTTHEPHAVRIVCALTRISWRLAGGPTAGHVDGDRSVAQFCRPMGLALTPCGGLLVADTGNNALRRVSATGFVQTLPVFDTRDRTPLPLAAPRDVDVDVHGCAVVADTEAHCLRIVAPDGGACAAVPLLHAPGSVAIDRDGTVWVLPHKSDGVLYRVKDCGLAAGVRSFHHVLSLSTLNVEARLTLGLQLHQADEITPENASVLDSEENKLATVRKRVRNFEAFWARARTASSQAVQDDERAVFDWVSLHEGECSDGLEDICCPITHCVMRDPVVAADNNTYERSAIERWFTKSKTFPLTNQKALGPEGLVLRSNLALKKIIEKRMKERRRRLHKRVASGAALDVKSAA